MLMRKTKVFPVYQTRGLFGSSLLLIKAFLLTSAKSVLIATGSIPAEKVWTSCLCAEGRLNLALCDIIADGEAHSFQTVTDLAIFLLAAPEMQLNVVNKMITE